MQEYIKIILTILISSVKFAVGPAFAYYNNQYPFTNFQVILYCVAGGMLGVFIFSLFTPTVFKIIQWIRYYFYLLFRKTRLLKVDTERKLSWYARFLIYTNEKKNKKRVFTKHNRRIVHVWSKYGLLGLAALTPVLISIPIGSILATRYVKNKGKVFLYMFISILSWSVIMVSTFETLHVINIREVEQELLNSNDTIPQQIEKR